MKKFNEWNEIKKQVDNRKNVVNFKNREIYWASIGENIGFEQNGKGQEFSRPVLVVKKLNRNLFLGVPLSTQRKQGSYFFEFILNDKISTALLVQAKIFDVKRLDQKIGMIDKENFENLKKGLKDLLEL